MTLNSEHARSPGIASGVFGQLAPNFSGTDAKAWYLAVQAPQLRKAGLSSPSQGLRQRPGLP